MDASPSVHTKAVNIRQMPVDLWRLLKVQAAVEGITVQAAVTKAIAQYVKAA